MDGGFDLAAQWMGWNNVFNCEWEEFPRQVLKHHFPNAIQHGDIKELDATTYAGRIDILTGGFPCQPYSLAGKRKGNQDERHLWPEMLRVIRECAPRYVVGENVRGLVGWNGGLVFEEVCATWKLKGTTYNRLYFQLAVLELLTGYRVFIVAYSSDARGLSSNGKSKQWDGRRRGFRHHAHRRRVWFVARESRFFDKASAATDWENSNVPFVCGGDDGLPKATASPFTGKHKSVYI